MKPVRNSESGAEALEFAVVAPVLVALLLMIIEGALLFSTWLNVNHATREAARYGVSGALVDASNPPSASAIATSTYGQAETLVQGLVGATLGQCAGGGTTNCIAVAVQSDPLTGYPTQVTVTTYYTVTTITPIIQNLVPSVALRANVAMRAE